MRNHLGHDFRNCDGLVVCVLCDSKAGSFWAGRRCDSVFVDENDDADHYQQLLDSWDDPTVREPAVQDRTEGWFDRLAAREQVTEDNRQRRTA